MLEEACLINVVGEGGNKRGGGFDTHGGRLFGSCFTFFNRVPFTLHISETGYLDCEVCIVCSNANNLSRRVSACCVSGSPEGRIRFCCISQEED
jgi:hypothetical protein